MNEVFGSEQEVTQLALGNVGDEGLNVRFYLRSVMDPLASYGGEVEEEIVNEDGTVTLKRKRLKGAGHPVFKDVEYCEIKSPGEAKYVTIDAPAKRNGYIRRFARQYEAFKKGETARQQGWALSEWTGCTRAEADNLAIQGVHTVEQLATLSDGAGQHIGPIQALRKRAQDSLEAAKQMAPLTQMRAEMNAKDARMAAMEAQLEALLTAQTLPPKAQTDAAPSVAPAPVKRGRKPKSQPSAQ